MKTLRLQPQTPNGKRCRIRATSISGAQKLAVGSIKHDISVPVSKIPKFMETAEKAMLSAIPSARICAFVHLGDYKIHYNISNR